MTLGMVWVRAVGGIRELIIASDSRLSGGQYWDSNPKIILLPRTDAVISFAGSTSDAYPLILQAYNSIKMYEPAENRVLDLAELKGHLLRIFNHSRKFITGLPRGQKLPDKPEVEFMLSGYSWRDKNFRAWKLHYNQTIDKFTFRPIHEWKRGQGGNSHKFISIIGDKDVRNVANDMIISLLRKNGKLTSGSFDMEPFEILRDIIRCKKYQSVGGPVQIVKIYEHANAVPVGVYWPNKESGVISLLGRPLLDYEKSRWGVIDPDAPTRAYPPADKSRTPG
ncbi:hypothetical protein L2U69_04420 [Zavarzinia compransoris]|uniref:hypothetical protein n=1 Tax=Zavarzinia marina TaxID=2911065 RepID=UPI001F1AFCD2|nr:hypothetical protein [Zavarzinia marina]MCF4164881.1 hypothetical protein [Zavarzinia marina]